MAVRNRTLTDNAFGTKVLVSLDDHGSAVTIDASELANAAGTGNRLDIKRIEWCLDKEVAITFTGVFIRWSILFNGLTSICEDGIKQGKPSTVAINPPFTFPVI